jgi:AAA domain
MNDRRPIPLDEALYLEASEREGNEAARGKRNERQRPNGGEGDKPASAAATIKATPFVWRDPVMIPPRRWIYGRHYIRKFITASVATGGVGKSSLAIAELLSIVTGRALLDITPNERVNVWYWNGEDPEDELERRIVATCLHYGINPSDIKGRLFVDTGRKVKITIAEQTRSGAVIARPVVDAVIATIKENKLGVMSVDPFVASHRITENDNGAIELVAATWAEIADVTDCSIELVHHTRKTGGAEVTTEDGRGASALLAKARSGRALNQMSKDEAAMAGVENRRNYFRVEKDKANMAPPADQADWYRLASVDLGNGDNVGVATKWTWPDAFSDVTVSDLRAVQAAVIAGRWHESAQAKDWAGHAVAGVLKLDATNKAHRAKIASLLKTWIANEMFVVVEGEDAARIKRKFIEVGKPATDGK